MTGISFLSYCCPASCSNTGQNPPAALLNAQQIRGAAAHTRTSSQIPIDPGMCVFWNALASSNLQHNNRFNLSYLVYVNMGSYNHN